MTKRRFRALENRYETDPSTDQDLLSPHVLVSSLCSPSDYVVSLDREPVTAPLSAAECQQNQGVCEIQSRPRDHMFLTLPLRRFE